MRFFLLLVGGVFVRVYLQGRHTRTARFVFFFGGGQKSFVDGFYFVFGFWIGDQKSQRSRSSNMGCFVCVCILNCDNIWPAY